MYGENVIFNFSSDFLNNLHNVENIVVSDGLLLMYNRCESMREQETDIYRNKKP